MWGGSSGSNSEALEGLCVNFLLECVNLATLGLCFQSLHLEGEWIKLQEAVVTLMTQGKLTSLVFCNYDVYRLGRRRNRESSVHPILQAVADSDIAQSRLKSLHLALSVTSPAIDALVRSNFPNLESLIIGKTSRERTRLREVDGWQRLDSLTRLELHRPSGIETEDVPKLVAFFPALRELLVSGLPYQSSEDFSSRYPEGWHLLPNALCNTHRPLEWIHVSNAYDTYPIQFIGVIPTKVLTITDAELGYLKYLLPVLEYNVHLFPGMQVLRYRERSDVSEYQWNIDDAYDPIVLEYALGEWCAARGVELVKLEPKLVDQYSRKYTVQCNEVR
jgi:hypothetical protein